MSSNNAFMNKICDRTKYGNNFYGTLFKTLWCLECVLSFVPSGVVILFEKSLEKKLFKF